MAAKIKGKEGHRRGLESEERFGLVCGSFEQRGLFPPWLRKMRKAVSRDLDHDWVAETTEDLEILIDVKYSVTGLLNFFKKLRRKKINRRHIVFVIADPKYSDGKIYQETIRRVAKRRRELLSSRAAGG